MPVQIGQKPGHDFSRPLGLLADCHRRIERFLAVVAKVAAESALDEDRRNALDAALRYFREAAPKHTADEEESLFPRLRAVETARAELGDLERLEADHDRADRLHAEADALGRAWLQDGALPADRAARFREIAADLAELYRAHIDIEDNRLFPLAARLLPMETQQEIGREMAARRIAR